MEKIKISSTKDHFIKGEKAFFYLADTIWSAFSHISLEEWEEYLSYRNIQGFNVLQIIIQPPWDASESDIQIKPFKTDSKGNYDFFDINDEYFIRAQKMLDMATEKDFIPAMAILWCNNVADTWASKKLPHHLMPFKAVKPYVEYIVKAFSKYNPIYLISGDTDFGSEQTTLYYMTALEVVKSISPDVLTTMHLQPDVYLPDVFINSKLLDFYMYQSGHRIEEQSLSYKLAQKFYKQSVKRPIVNGEPCYEGSGYGFKYGRFSAFDVRKAILQSLLSGAKAGVTYGAHGVWGWHKKGKKFPGEYFSSTPYDWKTALRLKGAWDAAFIKRIFEKYELYDIEPQDSIMNETEEIRISVSIDQKKVALYVPYNTDVKVNMDLRRYDWIMINLSDRYISKPDIQIKKDSSVIGMHNFDSDVLILGMK